MLNELSLPFIHLLSCIFVHLTNLSHYLSLSKHNSQAHIVRAALESSAFQTVEVSDAMQLDSQHRMPLTTLRVDGGMTANSLLMQFLSDLLEVPLVR